MIKHGMLLGVLSGTLMPIACANGSATQVSEEACQEVLASFSVVPTTVQTDAERRSMLKTINAIQEAEFAQPCSRYPDWRAQFDAAYRSAL